MRIRAISIPSNIEGDSGRKFRKEYYQFNAISYGSTLELETQIIISKNLIFISIENFLWINGLIEKIAKILNKMMLKLRGTLHINGTTYFS